MSNDLLNESAEILQTVEQLTEQLNSASPKVFELVASALKDRISEFEIDAGTRRQYRYLVPAIRKIGQV